MKTFKLVTRVSNIATNCRITPGYFPVPVETQVKRHELFNRLGCRLVEFQSAHTLTRHLRTHDFVMVERDGPVLLENARIGLAHIVHQRRESENEVGAGHWAIRAGLQRDRLVEDGQSVLVDVLMAVVLVHGFHQRGEFRQDNLGNSRVNHQFEAPPRPVRNDQTLQFGANSFC